MCKFKVGDRVTVIVDGESLSKGATGTVCDSSGDSIGVRWDTPFDHFHRCNGTCEHGRGWYIRPHVIALMPMDSFSISVRDYIDRELRT